ncbi:MAG: glycosyltransferase [Betaproteobacteria bacterium]|nr:glycosyltransferase [Betaproteobacteria bacterium]
MQANGRAGATVKPSASAKPSSGSQQGRPKLSLVAPDARPSIPDSQPTPSRVKLPVVKPLPTKAKPLSPKPKPAVSKARSSASKAQPGAARKPLYVPVWFKFCTALFFGFAWAIFAALMATNWIIDLGRIIGKVPAYLGIYGIAVIPGFMNAFLISSLLMDRRPRCQVRTGPLPAITILVAAYNEQNSIAATIESISLQSYPGHVKVIVINDGSTDRTRQILSKISYPWLTVLNLKKNVGKAEALNEGLKLVTTLLTLTVDGDSYLYKDALENIVRRYMNDPVNTRAVAGAVLVRNSRKNMVTRIQEWDYFHGIAAIKRLQSLYQGTLVAQGAFSVYDTDTLRKIGGWPKTVGEDIVITWAILKAGYRVGFAENACLFTNAPDMWKQFIRQRQRWSRGMIEAFKMHGALLFKPRMTTLFIWWNLSFPYMDAAFSLMFIPGIVLALFGIYLIVGPMTLLVLPLSFLLNYIIFSIQSRMFTEQGLKVRKNFVGFVLYALCYSLVLQPACVTGYIQEFFVRAKKWGTK